MELNEHNKNEYPPMHTAEHLLNQTMVRMFGCARSKSSHIERKKSKCDYQIVQEPSITQLAAITQIMNEVIASNLQIVEELMSREKASHFFDLSKLPEDVTDVLRIVRIGDYDACPCIGQHVNNTSEIGIFQITSHDYVDGRWRVRFKLVQK